MCVMGRGLARATRRSDQGARDRQMNDDTYLRTYNKGMVLSSSFLLYPGLAVLTAAHRVVNTDLFLYVCMQAKLGVSQSKVRSVYGNLRSLYLPIYL